MGYLIYILRCGDGTLYTGSTTDVARRTAQLLDARGLRAEAGHRPEYSFLTFADAAYGERLRRKAFACDVA